MDLAERAGEIAMEMRPPPGSARAVLKGPQDWVSEADGAVERFLSEELAIAFPSDGFQGEEGGVSRGGALRWVVDPIDGTSNYARGAARFCVSLACMEGDTPLIGVIAAPALRETIWAWRGGGAWRNGDAIRAAETRDVSRSIMEIGWSRRRPDADYLKLCERILSDGASLRHGSGRCRDRPPGRLRGTAHQPVGCGRRPGHPARGRRQGQRLPGRGGRDAGQPDRRLCAGSGGCVVRPAGPAEAGLTGFAHH
jgi:hypothetical protein